MIIRLTNKTPWHGPDLVRIVRAALRAAGARAHKDHVLKVEIHNSRVVDYCRGFAFLGTREKPRRMRLYLPPPHRMNKTRVEFAIAVSRLAHHEALHSVGVEHTDMTEEQRYCRQPLTWAEDMPVRSKAELVEPKPKAELKKAAFDQKLAHVEEMHKRAVTRLKRAKTLEAKWARRLKLMQRRLP